EPTDAAAPFNDLTANAILRSSDNVDFRVHTVILTIASPIFTDMFSLPRPRPTTATVMTPIDDTRDGVPIIILTESSRTIDLFLRLLYPVSSPRVTELADIRILLEVSRKYEIEALAGVIRHGLLSTLEQDPVGVFALSISYGLDGIAAKAAHRCLRLSIYIQDSPELKYITADQYRRLLQFH
ncbi:hypothetical protein OF83DRAFT_1044597, partial [Amylostereum chailletii]